MGMTDQLADGIGIGIGIELIDWSLVRMRWKCLSSIRWEFWDKLFYLGPLVKGLVLVMFSVSLLGQHTRMLKVLITWASNPDRRSVFCDLNRESTENTRP